MTPKEYLSQAKDLKRKIDRKHQQIFELQAMAERTTSSCEALRISGTTSHSKLEDAVIKLSEIGDELGQDMVKYAKTYWEISAAIDTVENPTYRELLSLRYLSLKTWEEIAVEMHYAYRHVTRMHGEALQQVSVPTQLCP